MDLLDIYGVRAAIGQRSAGKTTFTIGNPQLNIKGFAEKYAMVHNMKVIFMDTIAQRPDYADFDTWDFKKLPELRRGSAVRVIVNMNNRYEVVQFIRDNIRDALIVCEDARNMVPKNIDGTVWEGLMIDSKNIRCSILFLYHNWKVVPPLMFTYLDELIIFKTKGTPQSRKLDIVNYEEVMEAYERVMQHKSPYHHEIAKNG